MKVLHLISSGGMYGAEAVILNLCAEMKDRGFGAAIGVFAPVGQPAPTFYDVARQKGIDAHLIACRGQADRSIPGAFRALAESTGADVVHTHGYKADIYAAMAWRRRRPVLVSTCHTWYDNDLALRVYGIADRWVLRRSDGVAAVSAEVRGQLVDARVPAERIQLIRNGVALQPFLLAERTRQRRRGRGLRVGLVGRLAAEKGIDVYLRAVQIVIRTHADVQFVVAGDGADRASLEVLSRELGVGKHVHFAGRQADMPAFYADMDLLVSSSRQEGLPVALLEGMASGLPVVATRVGAVPEAVVDGVTGLLVESGDACALAAAMLQLLADEELRTRFGQAGQQRVETEFSARRMTTDYLAFYDAAAVQHTGVPHLRTCAP